MYQDILLNEPSVIKNNHVLNIIQHSPDINEGEICFIASLSGRVWIFQDHNPRCSKLFQPAFHILTVVVDNSSHEIGRELLEMICVAGPMSGRLGEEIIELSDSLAAKSIRSVCEILDMVVVEIGEDSKTLRSRS